MSEGEVVALVLAVAAAAAGVYLISIRDRKDTMVDELFEAWFGRISDERPSGFFMFGGVFVIGMALLLVAIVAFG